jgi:K+-sensing histidine kinase KdpD
MKLFKLFGTVKSTKAINTKGVGLGLSIAKMISEEFKGGVAVLSKHGEGSVFMSSLEILPETENTKCKSKEEAELGKRLAKAKRAQLARAL